VARQERRPHFFPPEGGRRERTKVALLLLAEGRGRCRKKEKRHQLDSSLKKPGPEEVIKRKGRKMPLRRRDALTTDDMKREKPSRR